MAYSTYDAMSISSWPSWRSPGLRDCTQPAPGVSRILPSLRVCPELRAETDLIHIYMYIICMYKLSITCTYYMIYVKYFYTL